MCQSIGLVFALIAVGGGQALRAQAQNVPISDQMCPHNIGLVFALLLVGGGHAQQAPLRCIGCTRSVTLGLRSPLWICFSKMQKGQKWQFGDLVFTILSGSRYCVLKCYIIGVYLEGWCSNLLFFSDPGPAANPACYGTDTGMNATAGQVIPILQHHHPHQNRHLYQTDLHPFCSGG